MEQHSEQVSEISTRVEAFYHWRDIPVRRRSYLSLDSGAYIYIFDKKTGSDLVRQIISGSSVKRKLAATTLSLIRRLPQVAHIVPSIGEIAWTLPEHGPPELVIGKNRRIILININAGTVTKLPKNDPGQVKREIDVRGSLPQLDVMPAVIESNSEYPFLTEEFISGTSPQMGLSSWNHMVRALEQLQPIYTRERKPLETNTVVSRLEETDDTTERLSSAIKKYEIPDWIYRSRVHRDLTPRNIVLADDLRVIDWESSRIDFTYVDIYNWLQAIAVDQENPALFVNLIQNTDEAGVVHRASFAALDGLVTDGDSPHTGLPLVYLLTEYAESRDGVYDQIRPFIHDVLDLL